MSIVIDVCLLRGFKVCFLWIIGENCHLLLKRTSAESRVDLQKQLDDVFFKHCVEKHFGEIDWEP
jgi:hypothetical protein